MPVQNDKQHQVSRRELLAELRRSEAQYKSTIDSMT
ncbi:unnamed protein product, partial [marine sediment metagenome]